LIGVGQPKLEPPLRGPAPRVHQARKDYIPDDWENDDDDGDDGGDVEGQQTTEPTMPTMPTPPTMLQAEDEAGTPALSQESQSQSQSQSQGKGEMIKPLMCVRAYSYTTNWVIWLLLQKTLPSYNLQIAQRYQLQLVDGISDCHEEEESTSITSTATLLQRRFGTQSPFF
jgi:hypothetical protein